MSICSCSYETEQIGSMIRGPHTARKPGRVCPNCKQPVIPGQYGGLCERCHVASGRDDLAHGVKNV